MRLAVATSREFSHFHPDDVPLMHELPPFGLTPTPCVWNDPRIEWASFDAILIRTTWDYYQHYGEFVAWLNRLQAFGLPVVNPLSVVRWNLDKRYLLDLERADVPVVPSRVVTHAEIGDEIRRLGVTEAVVKPTIGAGAWHTLRLRADSAEIASVLAELPAHREYLVQPFVPAVETRGEWSLVYVRGVFSHAVLKRPAAGDYRVQEKLGGTVERADPPLAASAVAQRVLAALPDLGVRGVLVARVDLVEAEDGFRLMELELIEPQLYLRFDPDAGRRIARAIAVRLRESGPAATEVSL
jgi:glutathione synthase/RimK-type ligase-like ATP-grasp enzyme